VVGIDPGLGVTGYAVVEPTSKGPYVVEAGVLRPRGQSAKTLDGRLLLIHQGILEVLDAYPPSALALEQVHSHVNHPRTAILMAHARGVIVLAAAEPHDVADACAVALCHFQIARNLGGLEGL
jgi:crossover junction endodeoxyribonuclease RuvC